MCIKNKLNDESNFYGANNQKMVSFESPKLGAKSTMLKILSVFVSLILLGAIGVSVAYLSGI
jgi:hypothetical protein